MVKIKNVAIVGGTHGNEYTGTFLLRRWAKNPDEISRESFSTRTLWANPKAFYENKRYLDADLNRCFFLTDLADETIDTYEGNRAKVINSVLGPKGSPATDLIIDVHTATSNMGVTMIVVGGDKYDLQLAAYIKSNMPGEKPVNLYYIKAQSDGDHAFLASVAPRRIGLEIGPIAQGTLRHNIFDQANIAVRLALDFIHRMNTGDEPEHSEEVEVFEHREKVMFPLDEDGYISAMVHSALLDRDFEKIEKGDPLFVTIHGKTIAFENGKGSYPVFINEAAYYDEKTALVLTEKIFLPL